MKRLLTLDREDYTPEMPLRVKYSTRAVIQRDGRIAVQHGAKGDYKILGGGVDEGESLQEALCREVQEESGLIVIPESIRELGEVLEKRRDIFAPEEIYECHSVVFSCGVLDKVTETKMTESEIAAGYHLDWVTPEEFLAGNEPFCGNQFWSYRDMELVRLLLESGEIKV
ncbi:MAG: NUDIX domain-containing protein [Muribaculaceae bacterium]|nr:NUDIX domain-containing protein [Roseburia sp.]MCM1430790.1 NUDIX domain-containing protein [Muribaculaceae bacterium]MCM1492769.1 NUDIX domain-containing protein [Muribaculaceae bacterium]